MAKMLSTANYTQEPQREIVQWLLFSTRVNLMFVLELLCTTYHASYPVHYVKIAVLVATKHFWQWSGNFKVTLGAYLSQAAWKAHKLCLVIWLLQDQFSFLGNRARYEFIKLDMSTGLNQQIELRKPSSIGVYRSRYINRPQWTNRPQETVLDIYFFFIYLFLQFLADT